MWRFKTEEEFKKEFGMLWRNEIRSSWNEVGYMDHLFGWTPFDEDDQKEIDEIMRLRIPKNIPLNNDGIKRMEDKDMQWTYSYDMFVKVEEEVKKQLEFEF